MNMIRIVIDLISRARFADLDGENSPEGWRSRKFAVAKNPHAIILHLRLALFADGGLYR